LVNIQIIDRHFFVKISERQTKLTRAPASRTDKPEIHDTLAALAEDTYTRQSPPTPTKLLHQHQHNQPLANHHGQSQESDITTI
jgi:hypothetical protein